MQEQNESLLLPTEYYYSVQVANKALLKDVATNIRHYTPDHVCCVATGSHGKLESYSVSKIEIILIFKSQDDLISYPPNSLNAFIRRNPDLLEFGIEKEVELKNLDSNIPLSYVAQSKELVYPDRLLNAFYLCGDKDLFSKARNRVFNELIDSPWRTRIYRKMKKQYREYLRACTTGVFRHQQIFDTPLGVTYYYEGASDYRQNRFGFKPAFLRIVQRKLDLLTSQLPNSNEEIPTSTLKRIEYFTHLGLLPNSDKLSEAYTFFLQEYHKSQKRYEQNPTKLTVTPFDRDKFETHAKNILTSLAATTKSRSLS